MFATWSLSFLPSQKFSLLISSNFFTLRFSNSLLAIFWSQYLHWYNLAQVWYLLKKNVGFHFYPSVVWGPEKACIVRQVECLPTPYVARILKSVPRGYNIPSHAHSGIHSVHTRSNHFWQCLLNYTLEFLRFQTPNKTKHRWRFLHYVVSPPQPHTPRSGTT